MKRILLLGGVTEALAIARTLGPQHVYSLAGVGRVPTDLPCEVRIGGYGGAEGLAQYIREQHIDLLLDATHPYAAQISQNAALAAAASAIPCWALRRHQTRTARLVHRHTHQLISHFHGDLVVGDIDELHRLGHLFNQDRKSVV